MPSVIVVVAVWVPEVPVMMSVYWPMGAVLPAVTVSVLLPAVAGFGEKDAVTPLGRPENPYWEFT